MRLEQPLQVAHADDEEDGCGLERPERLNRKRDVKACSIDNGRGRGHLGLLEKERVEQSRSSAALEPLYFSTGSGCCK